MSRFVIIVTGTPGTGKTQVAKKIALQLNAEYLNINALIKKYRLSDGYDKKLATFLVNPKVLAPALLRIIKAQKKTVVIDGHLSHYLPRKKVDLCIVTKCDIKTLERRLRRRKYSRAKIQENLDAERFDVCLVDAAARKHNIRIVDTTKGIKHLDIRKFL